MYYPIKVIKTDYGTYRITSRDLTALNDASYDEASSEHDACALAELLIPKTIEVAYRQNLKPIPMPSRIEEGEIPIMMPIRFQLKLLLWNEMMSKHLRIKDLCTALSIKPAQASRLVDLRAKGASIESIEEALEAIGGMFTLTVEPAPKTPIKP